MNKVVAVSDPEILGGIPIFAGTDIPVRLLFERLAEGVSLDEILQAHPALKREQAVKALREADLAIERTVAPEHARDLQIEDEFFEWVNADSARLEQLKAEVKIGLDEANRGEVIDEDEVWASVYRKIDQIERKQGE